MKNLIKLNLQRISVLMLIAVMAFTFTACTAKEEAEVATTEATEEVTEVPATEEVTEEATEAETTEEATEESTEAPAEVVETEATVIGEGATAFFFDVEFEDGTVNKYEVNTDATMVGEALLALELIEGEDSEYGLYVKTVDGVTLDFDTDGAYWGFLVNGEMAAAGVDTTEIEAGATYTFAYAQ